MLSSPAVLHDVGRRADGTPVRTYRSDARIRPRQADHSGRRLATSVLRAAAAAAGADERPPTTHRPSRRRQQQQQHVGLQRGRQSVWRLLRPGRRRHRRRVAVTVFASRPSTAAAGASRPMRGGRGQRVDVIGYAADDVDDNDEHGPDGAELCHSVLTSSATDFSSSGLPIIG